MAFPVHPENRAAFLPLRSAQFPPQVDISGIQQTRVDMGINRAVRGWQFIPVAFTDSWERLPLLQQGGNGIIKPVQFLFCQRDSPAGFRKGLLVLLLGILYVIKHTAQPTTEPVATGIADKEGFLIIRPELLISVSFQLE